MKKKQVNIVKVTLDYLHKHYTTEQTFRAADLYYLASRHGKINVKSCANNALRSLITAGCVVRLEDEIENKHGGSDISLYQLTGKTSLGDKTAEHYANIAERNNKINQAQLALQAAFNNIARRQMGQVA